MVKYVTPAWTAPGVMFETYREPRSSWLVTVPDGNESTGYNFEAAENQRKDRYGLASACLGGAFHSFARFEDTGHQRWWTERLKFYSKHYVHPQRGKGWLGEPTGAAYHVTMQKDKPVDLWVRKFAHGFAIVNPSSKAHSIYSEKPLRPIGGVAKTGRSVPAHDGLLLEAV
jgi:hypothetical protein